MNLIFLVSFLLVLIIIVEISAISLKLTGMDLHMARFQALSALVTAGYTTSHSEMVVKHHTRRRIIMVLMVMGYLGTATIVTALIDIMRHPLTLLQVATAVALILIAVSIATTRSIRARLDKGIEQQLTRRYRSMQSRTVEEVLHLDRQYGVAEVVLRKDHHLIGQTIASSKVRDAEIFILAIERGTEFIHSPRGSQILEGEDKLIVYGKLQKIHLLLCQDCYRGEDTGA